VIADPPADELARIRERRGERAGEGEAARLRRHQRGGGAVAELQGGEQPLDILLVLEVEAGELDGDHQHPRLGLRADDMMGEPKRGDRRVAAHEAHQGPLDMAAQAQLGGDDLVDARSDEAGAAGDDQMGYSGGRRLVVEPGDGGERQLRRRLGVNVHPRPGGGQGAVVEAAGVDRGSAVRGGRKDGPAMVDPRAGGHPGEQGARPRLVQPGFGPADEGGVDVMLRNGGADRVEMGLGRTTPLRNGARLQRK
jgi:hypothetical protein